MRPHRDARWDVYELEVARFCHPLLAVVRIVNVDLKVRVQLFLAAFVFGRGDAVPRRELGVGRERRARNVVREQRRVGEHVAERDNIVLSNDPAAAVEWKLLCRLDDPVVVRVVERVTRDLLTWMTFSFRRTCEIRSEQSFEIFREGRRGKVSSPADEMRPSSYLSG